MEQPDFYKLAEQTLAALGISGDDSVYIDHTAATLRRAWNARGIADREAVKTTLLAVLKTKRTTLKQAEAELLRAIEACDDTTAHPPILDESLESRVRMLEINVAYLKRALSRDRPRYDTGSPYIKRKLG